jgi:uncharacterized protein YggE
MTKNLARATTLLLAGLLLAVPATAQDAPAAPAPPDPKARIAETSGIITQGVGAVEVKPDFVTVSLQVSGRGTSMLQATNQSRALASRIGEAVRKAGVAPADIAVNADGGAGFGGSGFGGGGLGGLGGGLGGGGTGQPASVGVSGVVTITVRDVNSLGKVLAAAAGSGATGQASVQYAVKDEKVGRNAALKAAVADALDKAQAMAEAANLRSLTLAALTEGFVQPPFGSGDIVDLAQVGASFSLPARTLVTTATVTARFTVNGLPQPLPSSGAARFNPTF